MTELTTEQVWDIEMNKEYAEYIKALRKTHTWRAVARDFTSQFCDRVNNNQILGMELCYKASHFLGEEKEWD